MQQAELLGAKLASRKYADTCDICAGAIEPFYQSRLDWVVAADKNDRNCACRRLRCQRSRGGRPDQNGDVITYQIGSQFRQSLVVAFCPSGLDSDVSAVNKSAVFETLLESI